MEAGIKYIIRINESNSNYEKLNGNIWEHYIPIGGSDALNEFEHRNDILAAYASYSLKLKKWGVKTGLRYEYTDLKATYPLDEEMDFGTDYSNLVPSFMATYKIDDTQNLRVGYNMRISRPGIWQLNPYVNTSNPNFISSGNPGLDAVKSHSINANYGFFNPKININLNLSYEFENDAIERITYTERQLNSFDPESEVYYTTYENIGKRKRLNASGYFNWNAHAKFRIHANFFGSYINLKANNETGLKNSGYTARLFSGAQYNLPGNVWLHFYYGVGGPWIGLTEKGGSFNYHSFQLRKSFKSDRLNLRMYIANPFIKHMKYTYTSHTNDYLQESYSRDNRQEVGLTLSFRFGEMKAQIKKTSRGISNDDSMSGEQGGQQGGGGQGGE
ncbi:MAG: outer membrane beta-barrel family protein [Candidatus Azobacteroides sp.]|nr:outer membrane beta-barrel family protein [Candidatus Azobacteroides sp.]